MYFITSAINTHSDILFQLRTKIFKTKIPVIKLLTQNFQNREEIKVLQPVQFIAWDLVRMHDYLKGV